MTPLDAPTYKTGTLAYLDTFSGLVPCKVIAINKGGPFAGWQSGQAELTVKLTATRKAYRKGETLTGRPASHVVPRNHVITRDQYPGQYRIRTNYLWQD